MSDTAAERTVAPKHLLALIRDANQKKTRMQSISGELGARIREAVENGHLNRKAFGLVAQLDRQDEDKRNDNVRAIRLYLDICESELWDDGHVGDMVDQAQRTASDEQAAVDEQMRTNGERVEAGIKAMPESAEKPKRGRPRKVKAEDAGKEDPVAALLERGRIDFLDGKPGMIPDDLQGKPRDAETYLQGWSDASPASAKARDAAEFDAAKPGRREPMPGAEAAGTYRTH